MTVNNISKKIKLLVTCLLGCTLLIAQQKQLSEIVHIDFPARTVKLSKEKLKAMIAEKKDSFLIPTNSTDEYYSIDSFFLNLYGERWMAPKNYLENRREEIEGLSKWVGMNGNCVSEIKKINNYRVLIASIESRGWGVYYFYSVNTKNNAVLNGSLSYLKHWNSDKVKASQVLDELLANIAYKL